MLFGGEKNISLIRKSESEIANLGVGRKFQKPTIFEDQSVMENLIMALKITVVLCQFFL